MSKYKINNGIWTTPVFHGNSYFFIERQEFKQVKEGKCKWFGVVTNQPYGICHDRILIDISCKSVYNGLNLWG